MLVNGKPVEFLPMTLLEYLQKEGYEPHSVVVERGREIITKERFAHVELRQDDEINILRFMGGG